ncbi:MAG: hypothetical protein M3P27_11355 [Acidobacteriota bacterium]|nr:hypothetical protein [Acidobacteriota bacterium]
MTSVLLAAALFASTSLVTEITESTTAVIGPNREQISVTASQPENEPEIQPRPFKVSVYSSSRSMATDLDGADPRPISLPIQPATGAQSEILQVRKFHWDSALRQSGQFLAIMHAFRFATEHSTRDEMGGPFWGDYFDSVLGGDGWDDGDPFFVNYIGHPIEGAVAAYIYIQNDDSSRTLEIDGSGEYWKSRLRATAWASVFSIQFELGPISEASLGNVGMHPDRYGQTYFGAVDLVVTPAVGLAWTIAEDSLDKYVVKAIERRTTSPVKRALARSFLNPSRSFANLMRGKHPWFRDDRPLKGGLVGWPTAPPPKARPADGLVGGSAATEPVRSPDSPVEPIR